MTLRQLCTKPAGEAAGKSAGKATAAAATAATAATAAAAASTAATAEAAAPLFVASDWLHFGVAIGAFYALNDALYKAFAVADIKFPASLVGMFGILGGLWGLSGAGQLSTAQSIVAAASPALKWVGRYLPLFYVPALVVLPLAIESLSASELGKIFKATFPGKCDALLGVSIIEQGNQGATTPDM